MKVKLAPGWKTELSHGPDWLFIRLYGPDGASSDAAGLADSLLLLLREEMKQRLVLELDGVLAITEGFVEEMLRLHAGVEANGGLLRLCGLSRVHRTIWREKDALCRLPQFRDREEAVMGFFRPGKPR